MTNILTQFQRKTNVFFFDVEEPAMADQLTYYGTIVASAIMTVLAAVCVC